ncbi:hypothetical protein NEUTE2DRAFT_59249 [Neurospora tetrasperma FGSC 2509]|nr:hypothetical protein NEUTE2DRAFT_59249 [Neurospora tetrasperma FGSC 2509]
MLEGCGIGKPERVQTLPCNNDNTITSTTRRSSKTQQGISGFPVASGVWGQTGSETPRSPLRLLVLGTVFSQHRSLNCELLHDKHLRTSSEIKIDSIDEKGTKTTKNSLKSKTLDQHSFGVCRSIASTDADHIRPRWEQDSMPKWAIMGVLAPRPRPRPTQ